MDNGKMRNGKWKEKNGKRNKKKNGNKGMKIEKKKILSMDVSAAHPITLCTQPLPGLLGLCPLT